MKPRIDPAYHAWQESTVHVGGQAVVVATKPGLLGHAFSDISTLLLAQHVRAEAGDVVLNTNCGNGLVGVLASAAARRIELTDRNFIAAEAAARTLSLNGVTNARSHLGHSSYPLDDGFFCHVAAIRIPHEKVALRQLLHDAFRALVPNGTCYVAGAVNEGIKSAAVILEHMFGSVEVLAFDGGHRVLKAVKRTTDLPVSANQGNSLSSDEFREVAVELRGHPRTLYTRPGVFSWDHLDEATELLAQCMSVNESDEVVDLGCGAGAIGIVAGALASSGHVTMLDVDSEAVRCAQQTAASAGLTNARILPSDVGSAVLSEQFDLVVSNPPFHVGKTTSLDVPMQFIQDAWTILRPGGRLNLVANRTLPYEGAIRWRFGNIVTLHDGQRFKVLSATKT